MIIWGSRGFRNFLGESILVDTCNRCGNEVRYHAYKSGRKFTLFFIPLFPYSVKYYLLCPICEYGYEFNKTEMQQYLAI